MVTKKILRDFKIQHLPSIRDIKGRSKRCHPGVMQSMADPSVGSPRLQICFFSQQL